MTARHSIGFQRTTASCVAPDAKNHPPVREGVLPIRQFVQGRMHIDIPRRDHGLQFRERRLEGRIAPQELPGPVTARQLHHRRHQRDARRDVVTRPRKDMRRP